MSLSETAKAAGLRYVSDSKPGIARVRARVGFRYRHPDGSKVSDEETLTRIRKLALPPVYENVWICTDPNGHLQAVGRDARGRKQYRYHPRWREVRDEGKYGKMLLFGKTLPRIRAQVEKDLARQGLPREKVLAAIIRLLETTLMRVGNEEYAKTNKSYGLTTLRNRHVKLEGASRISFDFRGKHGTEHHIDLRDKRLASIVRRCQELPGQELFHTSTTTARRTSSVPTMSTNTCALSRAPKSPRRIFARGPQPTWQRWRCGSLRVSTARRRPRATWCGQSKRSPKCLATRRRFVGNVTFIRRYSTGISMAPCCRR